MFKEMKRAFVSGCLVAMFIASTFGLGPIQLLQIGVAGGCLALFIALQWND